MFSSSSNSFRRRKRVGTRSTSSRKSRYRKITGTAGKTRKSRSRITGSAGKTRKSRSKSTETARNTRKSHRDEFMQTEDFAGVMVKYFSKDDLKRLEAVNDEWKGAVKLELQEREKEREKREKERELRDDKELIEDLVDRDYCEGCDAGEPYDRTNCWDEYDNFQPPESAKDSSIHHYPFLSIDYTNKKGESLPGKFYPGCCFSGNDEIPAGRYTGDC